MKLTPVIHKVLPEHLNSQISYLLGYGPDGLMNKNQTAENKQPDGRK